MISDGISEVVATGIVGKNRLTATLDGHQLTTHIYEEEGRKYTLFIDGERFTVTHLQPDFGDKDVDHGPAKFRAPMNGTVVSVVAPLEALLKSGAPLMIMEAMKMEHTIRAPQAGRVKAYYYKEGDLVNGGAELLQFEPEDE